MNNHLTPMNGRPADASPFDQIRRTRPDGSEYWAARDLMPLLGYDSWRRFESAIERARAAAEVQGHDPETLFAGAVKKSGGRPQQDVELTRFAAYLVAMLSDPDAMIQMLTAYKEEQTARAELEDKNWDLELADRVKDDGRGREGTATGGVCRGAVAVRGRHCGGEGAEAAGFRGSPTYAVEGDRGCSSGGPVQWPGSKSFPGKTVEIAQRANFLLGFSHNQKSPRVAATTGSTTEHTGGVQ